MVMMRERTSQLERYESRYRALAEQVATIGFISPGSLVSRTTTCGKPGCRCQADPPERHGPYYQWSRTVGGKTVSRRLSEAEADRYREWIANRRRIERLISEMAEISAAAGEILLRDAPRRTRP
jgi:hypothetical protein